MLLGRSRSLSSSQRLLEEFIKPGLSLLLNGANNPAEPVTDACDKWPAGFMWITSAAQPTSRLRAEADE
jgi:hypothetical protein